MLAFALIVVGSLELAARLYWWIDHGVPLHRPGHILYVFYPNLASLSRPKNPPTTDRRDLLVLGGSVIDEMREDFEDLAAPILGEVRFHVGARVAHTTLDSRRKTERLAAVPYDEILIYHGINDCKYNSVPAPLFDEDYSAYPFYKATKALLRHSEIDWLAFPFTLRFAWIRVTSIGDQKWRRPVVRARPEWRPHGRTIKTASTFRGNLESILEQAFTRQQTVHLTTFASFIPADYTLERFEAGALPYKDPRLPVEVWGDAQEVRRCIAVHNQILRDLADKHANAHLIELSPVFADSGDLFDDPCHFSPRGRELFIAELARNLLTPEADSGFARRGMSTGAVEVAAGPPTGSPAPD